VRWILRCRCTRTTRSSRAQTKWIRSHAQKPDDSSRHSDRMWRLADFRQTGIAHGKRWKRQINAISRFHGLLGSVVRARRSDVHDKWSRSGPWFGQLGKRAGWMRGPSIAHTRKRSVIKVRSQSPYSSVGRSVPEARLVDEHARREAGGGSRPKHPVTAVLTRAVILEMRPWPGSRRMSPRKAFRAGRWRFVRGRVRRCVSTADRWHRWRGRVRAGAARFRWTGCSAFTRSPKRL